MNSGNNWVEEIPEEILIHICSFNIPFPWTGCTSVTERISIPLTPFVHDIIHTSHVCQRWYHIITSTPMLWNTSVDPHHPRPEWVNLLSNRSGSLPIAFIPTPLSRFQEINLPEMLASEMQYSERLFQYVFAAHVATSETWELFKRGWPCLERLCFTMRYSIVLDNMKIKAKDFPGRLTPRLKLLHLHIGFITEPSQISQLGLLEELLIGNGRQANRFSLNTWRHILSNLPLLKRLHLSNAVKDNNELVNLPTTPLVLHLDKFCFTDQSTICNRVFQYLDVRNTRQTFRLLCMDTTSDDIPKRILSRIPPLTILHEHPSFSSVVLAFEENGVYIRCINQEIQEVSQIQECMKRSMHFRHQEIFSFDHPYLEYQFHGKLPDLNHEIYLQLQPLLPYAHIINLFNVIKEVERNPAIYLHMILQTSNTRYLSGVSQSLWAEIYAATMKSLNSNSRQAEDRILPALEVISFVDSYRGVLSLRRDEFEEKLIKFCSARRKLRLPMRHIHVIACEMKASKRLVQELNGMDVSILIGTSRM